MELAEIGLTRTEVASRLGLDLPDFLNRYSRAYSHGWSRHTEGIMRALWGRAISGDVQALKWLAEKHLGRGQEGEEDTRTRALKQLMALSPEDRRERIRALTEKIAVS